MDDMGFLILSDGGDGLGLAIRLMTEGHRVTMHIEDSVALKVGDGIVKVGEVPDSNPTYVADCTGLGHLLDAYRDPDRRTFGGSKIADDLETNREFSSEIFSRYGIEQPDSEIFEDWDEAERYIEAYKGETPLVFKPCGNDSGVLPSFVPESNEELLAMFKHFKQKIGEGEVKFALQEFIEGTCISSEVWCAKGKILKPFNHTLERKQFLNDDLGPSGGCTGNVVWVCNDKNCSLCENLLKLKEFLESTQWNGPLDINTVVDKNGQAYALEFTPRFGYDAFPAYLLGLFEGDFGAFINDCCRGDAPDQPLTDGFAAGIRLSLPPWPSQEFRAKPGVELRGLREFDFNRFYPYEVGFQEGSFVSSGGYGALGVSVGKGKDVEEAFEEAYAFTQKLRIPDVQYRTDFVEVFKKDLFRLRRAFDAEFART